MCHVSIAQALALACVLFLGIAHIAPVEGQTCDLSGGSWEGETDVIDGYPAVVSSTDVYQFDDDSGDAEGYTADAYSYIYNTLEGNPGELGSYKAKSEVTIIDDSGVTSCTVGVESYGVYSLSQDDVLTLYSTDCEISTCPDECAAYCFDGCMQDSTNEQVPPRVVDLVFSDDCNTFTLLGGTEFNRSTFAWWTGLVIGGSVIVCCLCVLTCVVLAIVVVVRRNKKKKEDHKQRVKTEPDAFEGLEEVDMNEVGAAGY